MKQNQNPRHNRQGRSGQHNNQKRSNKGRHNQNRQQQQPNSPTRQIDSRGPAGVQRGNAKQLYEKYKILAQDKRSINRQEFESLNQYADHYYRINAEFAAADAANQAKREKERARKAEEETARRANNSAEQASEDSKPENSKPENTEPENSETKTAAKPRRDNEEKKAEPTEQKAEA